MSEAQIWAGHFQATEQRLAEAEGRILMLQGTCEFSFQRDQNSALGLIGRTASGKGKDGRQKHFTVRGVLMHSSLAVTSDGLPLGLTANWLLILPKLCSCEVIWHAPAIRRRATWSCGVG